MSTQEPELAQPNRNADKRRLAPAIVWANQTTLHHEIGLMRRYLESVTSSFSRESKESKAFLVSRTVDATDEECQMLAEEWGEVASYYDIHFPAFAFQTTFVAIYSLLEDQMIAIAGLVGEHLGITLKPEELKDKGVFAAKKYLMALCHVRFPEQGHAWQEVVHYNRIRNICVHRRGRLAKDGDEKVRNYVGGKKSIRIGPGECLELSIEFCLEVLQTVEGLLNDLFKLARSAS